MWLVDEGTKDQIRPELLRKRNDEMRRVVGAGLEEDQRNRDQYAEKNLQRHLCSTGQTQVPLVDNLQIIIGKPDATECECRKHRDPYELIREISPQQRRYNDGDDDEYPTHRRRASLF